MHLTTISSVCSQSRPDVRPRIWANLSDKTDPQPLPNRPETDGQPSITRPKIAKGRQRSAVANGTRLIAHADKNSAEYRQYRDIVLDLVGHLGGDATVTQRAVIEEAAGLIVWCR